MHHPKGPWKTERECQRQDLFLVREGLQCANCGAVIGSNLPAHEPDMTRKETDAAVDANWADLLGEAKKLDGSHVPPLAK